MIPFVLVGLAACSTPTAADVIDRSAQPLCAKYKECADKDAWAAAYPKGVDECTQKTKEKVKAEHKDDMDKQSVCTDEEIDKCISDIKKLACPGNLDDLKVPCDC